jgi:hypothetical protein
VAQATFQGWRILSRRAAAAGLKAFVPGTIVTRWWVRKNRKMRSRSAGQCTARPTAPAAAAPVQAAGSLNRTASLVFPSSSVAVTVQSPGGSLSASGRLSWSVPRSVAR